MLSMFFSSVSVKGLAISCFYLSRVNLCHFDITEVAYDQKCEITFGKQEKTFTHR